MNNLTEYVAFAVIVALIILEFIQGLESASEESMKKFKEDYENRLDNCSEEDRAWIARSRDLFLESRQNNK